MKREKLMEHVTDTVNIKIEIDRHRCADESEVKQRIISDLKFLIDQLEKYDIRKGNAGDEVSVVEYEHIKN